MYVFKYLWLFHMAFSVMTQGISPDFGLSRKKKMWVYVMISIRPALSVAKTLALRFSWTHKCDKCQTDSDCTILTKLYPFIAYQNQWPWPHSKITAASNYFNWLWCALIRLSWNCVGFVITSTTPWLYHYFLTFACIKERWLTCFLMWQKTLTLPIYLIEAFQTVHLF